MSAVLTSRFLFSHHYLERICQEADDRTEATHLVADLRGWASGWDDSELSSLVGTQVRPTLVSLGFNYQEPSDGEDPHLVRLYASYRQEKQVGLCYVAHREDGETDLDSTIKGRHYAAEIIHALKEEELSWGLLTDGERWRIYHADELAPYETFLEIDLQQLLEDRGRAGRGDAAYLLHTLFTKSAFEADEDGECALERHLSASEKEASAIEKHLSKCIEDVLRDLCQGFVERDGQETYTSDQRDDVFRNATVLLYRLLFILYAEARDLLPLEIPVYHSASLDALVEQAAQYVKVTGLPDPDGTELWQDLSDLCSWINSGDEDHHIPAYNGDLFDDSDKRYIHDHTIADKYLAPALFSLGAIEGDSDSGYRRIDYRDLSVRHLGSIYEGLLQYKLFIAQERRVRRSDGKGGYTFPKLSETRLKKGEEDQVIELDEVYFADSAGERKAMGAYYTPEYIVDYIVQQTVRRGLEERRSSLEEQLPGWLKEVETAPPGERQRLQKVVDEKLLDFVEQEVLTFRVCDPAMGSGHFLVNAVHTITTFIVETLNLTPWENAEIDSDPVKWRRKVAKRCLYGVDLNALAVELAKLSLWLTTVAKGKPLSFLDHHLRQGNSLVGARLEDLVGLLDEPTDRQEKELSAGQISMFDAYPKFRAPLEEATDLVRGISARVADAAEDVESQASDYEQVRDELKSLRDLADLVTAQHFGLDVDEDQLRVIARCFLQDRSRLSEDHQALLGRAQELARNRSFFHWDLEFPETSVGRHCAPRNVGFSVLVGNPPYVRQEQLGRDKLYFARRFNAYNSAADLYVYFYEQSHELLCPNGRFGMVTSNKFMRSEYGKELRAYLVGNHCIDRIVDFGELPVFGDASTFPVILITRPKCERSGPAQETVAQQTLFAQMDSLDFSDLATAVDRQSEPLPAAAFQGHSWSLADADSALILDKMRQLGIPLEEYLAGDIRRGILTGFNRAFIIGASKRDALIEEDPKSRDIIKPVIFGADIRRYNIDFSEQYLIWTYIGVPIERYPAIFRHLKKYERELRSRQDKGPHWWELRACEYYQEMNEPKLVWGAFATEGRFVIDRDGLWVSAPAYFVPEDDPYLAAVLSSRLGFFALSHMCSVLGDATRGGRLVIRTAYINSFPVRRVFSTTPEEDRKRTVARLIDQYRSGKSDELLDEVSALLPRNADRAYLTSETGTAVTREKSGVVRDLVIYLSEKMLELSDLRHNLASRLDLFKYVDRSQAFVGLDDAFLPERGFQLGALIDLKTVHHDVDGLRLNNNNDGTWTLELKAKFRDPEEGWQEWVKEEDGHMIRRQWVPAYRLQLSEEKARFYRYALPRLHDFDNASSFPGGYTRSTLKKLHLTKVPMMPDVDLSELARLDQELTETKRKIELTDDLIDQIVYKLYGLTEKEIAIVEGQT